VAIYTLLIPNNQKSDCQAAINEAEALLCTKLGKSAKKLLAPLTIKIGDNLTDSGGQAFAEKNLILFDAGKNKMSLQAAEDLLAGHKVLKKGDWTSVLMSSKDKPWSCLTYQLIHELGHIVDGQVDDGNQYRRVDAKGSPTLYGTGKSSEAFAELFTYWVFGAEIAEEFVIIFTELIHKNWNEL